MAHTLDTSQRWIHSNLATVQQTYTCGAGTTVLVVSFGARPNSPTRTGTVTYNGVNMTQGDQTRTATAEVAVEVWYLLDPPTGVAYTIAVPNGNGQDIAITAASFKAQAGWKSAYDTGNGNITTGTSPSQAVTTTVDGAAVFQLAAHSTNNLGTPTYSHSVIGAAQDHGQWVSAAQYALQGTLGTITMTITNLAASGAYATSVVAFKEYLPTSQKTILGVTRANVKTVMGLPIASMKNWGGLP